METWFRRKIISGGNISEMIGHPTLSFHVGDFEKAHSAGLYGCEIEGKAGAFRAALYFGPKMGTGEMVLQAYGSNCVGPREGGSLKIRILGKIRNAVCFGRPEDIPSQIKRDLEHIATL